MTRSNSFFIQVKLSEIGNNPLKGSFVLFLFLHDFPMKFKFKYSDQSIFTQGNLFHYRSLTWRRREHSGNPARETQGAGSQQPGTEQLKNPLWIAQSTAVHNRWNTIDHRKCMQKTPQNAANTVFASTPLVFHLWTISPKRNELPQNNKTVKWKKTSQRQLKKITKYKYIFIHTYILRYFKQSNLYFLRTEILEDDLSLYVLQHDTDTFLSVRL